MSSVLAAIHAANTGLGAFVAVAGEQALREAEAADRLIADLGADAWARRPLLGITVAVKDLIQTEQLPTGRGSLLTNRRPAADAPAVARLRAAGAIVVGKTATSEHGWSASTVSQVAAPTRNPWDSQRSAGGSSGGSAAAVAAGLCDAALGTDGAGSIRVPAAFCGVVGYKPSFGLVPYVPPCADRLAHVGPLTRTVADAGLLTSVLAGPHHDDPDSAGPGSAGPGSAGTAGPPPAGHDQPPASLRIGWIEFPRTTQGVRAVSERARSLLTALGHQVDSLDEPFADPYGALVDLMAAAEAAGTRSADEQWCDPGRLAVVRYGRTVSGAAVLRAEQVRLALRSRLRSVLDRYDLLAMATVPAEPFGVAEIAPAWAANPADLQWLAWTPATYPFNMTGQPALSLPSGRTAHGLPVGLQLVGPLGGDDLLLSAAGGIEAALGPLPAPPVPPVPPVPPDPRNDETRGS